MKVTSLNLSGLLLLAAMISVIILPKGCYTEQVDTPEAYDYSDYLGGENLPSVDFGQEEFTQVEIEYMEVMAPHSPTRDAKGQIKSLSTSPRDWSFGEWSLVLDKVMTALVALENKLRGNQLQITDEAVLVGILDLLHVLDTHEKDCPDELRVVLRSAITKAVGLLKAIATPLEQSMNPNRQFHPDFDPRLNILPVGIRWE